MKFSAILNRLFSPASSSNTQAVIVYLPSDQQDEIDRLEYQLVRKIKKAKLGEFDGIERGKSGTVMYMYSPDAESLFREIESILRNASVCKGARIVIRAGDPGAPQREVVLPA